MREATILTGLAWVAVGLLLALVGLWATQSRPSPLYDAYDGTLRDSAGYQLLDASKHYSKGWTGARDGKLVKVWLEDME